jgi:ZIP family zinc transporter
MASSSKYTSKDIAIAFSVTLIAGLSTAIGGAVVFFPQLANRKFLSAGLALAAGALTYLSFIDLFAESIEFFGMAVAAQNTKSIEEMSAGEASSHSDHHNHRSLSSSSSHDDGEARFASLYTNLCFFAGISIMWFISFIVNKINPDLHGHELLPNAVPEKNLTIGQESHLIKMESNTVYRTDAEETLDNKDIEETKTDLESNPLGQTIETCKKKHDSSLFVLEKRSLWLSGVMTGVALFLHNLPEGIITYVATVEDPVVGVALGIGIALHNIPEGMSVALPLYFSNGRKGIAFAMSLFLGLSQLIGALLSYGILAARGFSLEAFGVMFGMASGMLMYISIANLLPTAIHYDESKGGIVTPYFVAGMFLIAIALVTLEASGNHNHNVSSAIDDDLILSDDNIFHDHDH